MPVQQGALCVGTGGGIPVASMGASGSSAGGDEIEDSDLGNLHGYRVMQVFKGSPAAKSGLAPFEDFIVAVNNELCDTENYSLGNLLKRNENKDVDLLVWNCIDELEREVVLRPMRWSGPGLLGAAVKHEKLEHSTDFIWHVMDLSPKGPADAAGLVPNTDYIVGTPASVFKREDEMNFLLKNAATKGELVTLCVYSSATGRLREVDITPNDRWGGKGLVGCELATGWLHRIPPRVDVQEARKAQERPARSDVRRQLEARGSLRPEGPPKQASNELVQKPSGRRSSRDDAGLNRGQG